MLGFKDDFLNNPDSEIYQDNFKECDTIAIPNKITAIDNYAFLNNSTLQTTIPEFITKLSFSKKSNCSLIRQILSPNVRRLLLYICQVVLLQLAALPLAVVLH